MDNIFVSIAKRAVDYAAERIAFYMTPERAKMMERSQNYYEGKQDKQLIVKSGQYNDNLNTNFVALAVDRSTAMLFGGGVRFNVPEGNEHEKKQYLDDTWKANKKNILLTRWGNDGELWGTSYLKLVPGGVSYNGYEYTRIVLLDPKLMAIEADPLDADKVLKYIFEVKIGDDVYREIIKPVTEDDFGLFDQSPPPDSWMIAKYRTVRGGVLQPIGDPILWAYDFPPIIHVHNMPGIHNIYGRTDVPGLIDAQDKYNFTISNMLKIVRYHANPRPYIIGVIAKAIERLSTGPDETTVIPAPDAKVGTLEMQSDLASSRNIAHDLRQSIFDLIRVVDISSITDKVGQLTNFGLRVLYSDAIAKNSVKRSLYGDALVEINRRILVLADMDGANSVEWGSDMPADEKEDAELILKDLAAGLVSKETASEKRGYQWETNDNGKSIMMGEKDKIQGEAADTANTANDALARLLAGG